MLWSSHDPDLADVKEWAKDVAYYTTNWDGELGPLLKFLQDGQYTQDLTLDVVAKINKRNSAIITNRSKSPAVTACVFASCLCGSSYSC
jgi:hypothetical protein